MKQYIILCLLVLFVLNRIMAQNNNYSIANGDIYVSFNYKVIKSDSSCNFKITSYVKNVGKYPIIIKPLSRIGISPMGNEIFIGVLTSINESVNTGIPKIVTYLLPEDTMSSTTFINIDCDDNYLGSINSFDLKSKELNISFDYMKVIKKKEINEFNIHAFLLPQKKKKVYMIPYYFTEAKMKQKVKMFYIKDDEAKKEYSIIEKDREMYVIFMSEEYNKYCERLILTVPFNYTKTGK